MDDMVGKYLMRWRIKTVLPYIKGNLLDIGCGTNELVQQYQGKGKGVDVFQWGNVDIVVENTAELPFSENEFETVTIIAALNHIPNREDVLREAHRVLVDGGRIIVTMIPPTISEIWHKLRYPWDVDQKVRGMKKGEVYGLSRIEVHRLLQNVGFEIEKEKGFMFGINRMTIARVNNQKRKPNKQV